MSNQLHWWLGRLTIVLGWVTIFLGMNLFGAPSPFLICFGFLIGAYALAIIYLELYKYVKGDFIHQQGEPLLKTIGE